MEDISIRAGQQSDHGPCADLWMRAVALRDHTRSSSVVRERAAKKLEQQPSILLVATDDVGLLLGYALTILNTASSAHLTQLAVHPGVQNRGIGSELLRSTLTASAARCVQQISLRVLADNLPARALYDRQGWTIVGTGHFLDSCRPHVTYARDPSSV